MTHPLAALIAGVPRYEPRSDAIMRLRQHGRWLHRLDVLAALEAATPPDLVEAGKVLEGVTPGPWHTHPVDDTAIISSNGTDVGTTCDSAKAERDDAYNNNYEQMEADARFIAWCREGVPALIALATAQAAQIAGLTKERDEAREQARMNSFAGEGYVFMQQRAEAAEAKVEELEAQIAKGNIHE